MIKRLIALILCILLLAGCWDYRGLNEQTIAVGIAVDTSETGGYLLTFEVLDLQGNGGTLGSSLFTTEGQTMAEAMFHAHAELHETIYLGITNVVIISADIAETKGISAIVEYFMRDQNARNSVQLVLANTPRASDLLTPPEAEDRAGQAILSRVLSDRLKAQPGTRANYQISNLLQAGQGTITLPIIQPSTAEDVPFARQGLALFTGDKKTSTLAEENMPYYLLATAKLRDQAFPLDVQGTRVALIARHSRSTVSAAHNASDTFVFTITIRITADVKELPPHNENTQALIQTIEQTANNHLSAQVTSLVRHLAQQGYDPFGLSAAAYRQAPHQQKNWRQLLEESEIHVTVETSVQSTGMLRR